MLNPGPVRAAGVTALLRTVGHDPLHARADVALARSAVERDAIQKVTELAPLIAFLRRRRPRTIVEIGTERGGTFWVWTRLAAPDAVLVSVDWPDSAVQELATPEALKALAGEQQEVVVVRGDSHAQSTFAAVAGALGGREVDLLFIDGDHTYEGVRRDFELYSPLVGPRGLIALHDVAEHAPEMGVGVHRFWLELQRGHRTRTLLDPGGDRGFGPWGGIGVVFGPR